MRGTKLVGVLGVSAMTLFLGGVAGAQSAKAPKFQEINVTKQEAASEGEVGESTPAGSRLAEGRTGSGAAASRTRDLDQQTQDLRKDLETQREAAVVSQAGLERRFKAVYKGEDLAGVTSALRSLFAGSANTDTALNNPALRRITRGRENARFHRDSQRVLEDTLRQRDQKKKEHDESREEKPTRTQEARREPKLQVSVGGADSKKELLERRITQLRAADEAGLFERPPVSGGAAEFKEQELEVAREDIVALPVEPIPYERYVQIYKASAKRYGFARDWYVLAAVGKVESNHGENMGPSSAGAMGPMQFLPSTWREYGVDGNKDGMANIMDPEDAIPAAASYLEAGGAPEDWYAALYTYNHAGWYVRKVLGVAESYRRLAKDDEVDPYL